MATSQPCDVKLDVYGAAEALNRATGAQTGTVSEPTIGSASAPTVMVGRGLHIVVVTTPAIGDPPEALGVPPETLCSYNVTLHITGEGEGNLTGDWDLGGLLLLDVGAAGSRYQGGLGYAEGRLPTFVTPPADYADLRIMQGSCSCLTGDGRSMMPAIDGIIEDGLPADATAAKRRPHLLALTGDQIYSDDVATPLLPHLAAIGARLLNAQTTETVPIPGATSTPVPVTMDALPAGRRLKLARITAGTTTDDGDDHLIGFGEFAAMYLLSWTGRLDGRLPGLTQPIWPTATSLTVLDNNRFDALPTDNPPVALSKTLWETQPKSPAEALLTPLYAPEGAKQLAKLLDEFPVRRRDAAQAGDEGENVRRALANVPTLMICDDHEVTDDWFINGAWRARVLASPLGLAIVRNSLVAYVLFQAWGNTPEAFATPGTPEAQFLELVPQLFTGSEVPDSATCKKIDTLLGLDDPTGTGTSPRIAFNYHVDLAGARLVVLDTRNHRDYGTPNGPPGLLTQQALDAQLPISLTDDVPLLIIVSPAPVLGPRVMEELLLPIYTRWLDIAHMATMSDDLTPALGYDQRKPVGDLLIDVEQWASRPASFERFLARASRCPRVVFLAGDVHFAASFVMDYQRFDVPAADGGVPSLDPPAPTATSRLVNFTSSPLHNEWPKAIPALVRTVGLIESLEPFGYNGARLGWTKLTPAVFTATDDVASDEPRTLRARLLREPVILPTNGWNNVHAIRHPEWAYQVAPLRDTRTDDVRFASLQPLGFTQALGPAVSDPPLTGDSWVESGGPYETASLLHAANLDGAAVTRTLVFQNNVGLVTFSRPGPTGPLSAAMTLYFVRPYPASVDERPGPYVVHETQLEPSPLDAPTQLGPLPSTPAGG